MNGAYRTSANVPWAAAALVLAIAASAMGAIAAGGDQQEVMWAVAAASVGVPLAYFIWHTDPAYTLTAGIVLSAFGGNWPAVGVPGPLSPDRLLLLAGVAAVLLRAPAIRDRPRLRIEPVHWVLAAAALYATLSAAASGTLFEKDEFFLLFEAFGILPFLIFLVAPLAFRTRNQRLVLLAGLVVLGAYLGLTALFQATGLDALVFPKYILDPNYGIHRGRVRGPFAEAVTNGVGLYVCAVAAAIALMLWKRRIARLVAVSVAGLCLMGTLLGLERAVWLGAAIGTVATITMLSEGRRMFLRIVPALVIALAIALAAVPDLREQISDRYGDQSTIYARQNLNRAALNMVEARPIFGFGWGGYNKYGRDYFQQSPNYPFTSKLSGVPPHNLLLTYAADLGLVGTVLWVVGIGLMVGGALAVRGPPDLELWRIGLIPITIFIVIAVNFIPASAGFTFRALCLWAGVVWSGRYLEGQDGLRSQAHP